MGLIVELSARKSTSSFLLFHDLIIFTIDNSQNCQKTIQYVVKSFWQLTSKAMYAFEAVSCKILFERDAFKSSLWEVMGCAWQLSTLPESVIVETTEYKCLQSQFSVLYNESMQIKTQLDEARALLTTSKNAHLRQIEQMEVTAIESSLILCHSGQATFHRPPFTPVY